MIRVFFPLVLCLALAGCFNDDSEEVAVLEETLSTQDSIIAAQRAELDGLRAAFDTARTVAADSALAYGGEDALAVEDALRPWPAPDALAYDTYRNERLGYTLEYPSNLLQPEEVIGDGHGQTFSSPEGSATLLVYGTDEGGGDRLREEYEAELARTDLRVTYQVIRPTWFVVSGYQGPYIFYQRTHRSGDGLRTFRLRHRASEKAYFDPIVERLSHSFAG